MNPAALAKLRERRTVDAFCRYDVNRDDSIDRSELETCLLDMGFDHQYVQANIQPMLSKYGRAAECEKLNLDEFIALYNGLQDQLRKDPACFALAALPTHSTPPSPPPRPSLRHPSHALFRPLP